MENLILNIGQNYVVVGIVLAILTDITVRTIKVAKPFTFAEITAVIFIWPVVVGMLINKYTNTQL